MKYSHYDRLARRIDQPKPVEGGVAFSLRAYPVAVEWNPTLASVERLAKALGVEVMVIKME